MRRKGELSPADVDRGWPYQVVLPARLCEGGGHNEIHDFCKDLTLCTRDHAAYDQKWFHVYCFTDPADTEKFKNRFGGEKFDPTQRGTGSNWAVGKGAKLPFILAMCGRVRLSSDYSETKIRLWFAPDSVVPNFEADWNKPPTEPMLVANGD
jgi:hypothetical protein